VSFLLLLNFQVEAKIAYSASFPAINNQNNDLQVQERVQKKDNTMWYYIISWLILLMIWGYMSFSHLYPKKDATTKDEK
jgi:uncharacterized membrane protein